jgi:large subunit ribosomal protein L25
MSNLVLKAEKREKFGSITAKKIKNSGRIPAVIYSKSGNINLSLDKQALEQEYFKGNLQAKVVEIDFSDKKIKAIAHQIDTDPVSDRPIHIDFFNCDETKSVKAKPKINFLNQDKSPGLKKGGFLHIVVRKVGVLCDGETPEKIDVDVGSLQVGQKIRAGDLILQNGVSLAKKSNFLIASIVGRGKAEEESATAAVTMATASATDAGVTKTEDKKPAEKKPAEKKSDKK